jgi:predicted regulator of Ras-like GTPase activity (Roadblock/LC7/MglB family)
MAKEEAEIKELSKKLAQNPDSMVFVQLADACRRAGDLEKSVEVCLQGLQRHPTYTTARAILGRNYLDLGKLDEAASEFRQIEVADPENILAHRMLGQIALNKGQFAEAIARQQKVLALDPDDNTAQDLLRQALAQAKQTEGAAAPAGPAPAPKAEAAAPDSQRSRGGNEQSQALKVADIYIKKHALDEAVEVIQEILTADPDNALARQKLKEINAMRGSMAGNALKDEPPAKSGADEAQKAEEEARKKAEEESRKKAEEEARKKAEEETRKKAEEEARKKAEEESRKKAEEEARKKAEEESRKKAEEEARKKAEEEARKKAEEESRKKAEEEARKKAEEESRKKAEEEARKKAEEESRQKAEEEARKKAEEESRQKAEEEARKKAEEESRKKAEEEARKKAEEEETARRAEEEARAQAEAETKARKANKLTSDDIFSVIAQSADDLIENEASGAKAAPAATAAAAAAGGPSPEARQLIEAFLKAQAIEASLLLDAKGAVLESRVAGDAAVLGQAAGAIFHNTERAAMNMRFGGLKQIMIMGQDNRQILFVALKAGVLVAVTGNNTNLGLLRVAVSDLTKRA